MDFYLFIYLNNVNRWEIAGTKSSFIKTGTFFTQLIIISNNLNWVAGGRRMQVIADTHLLRIEAFWPNYTSIVYHRTAREHH